MKWWCSQLEMEFLTQEFKFTVNCVWVLCEYYLVLHYYYYFFFSAASTGWPKENAEQTILDPRQFQCLSILTCPHLHENSCSCFDGIPSHLNDGIRNSQKLKLPSNARNLIEICHFTLYRPDAVNSSITTVRFHYFSDEKMCFRLPTIGYIWH